MTREEYAEYVKWLEEHSNWDFTVDATTGRVLYASRRAFYVKDGKLYGDHGYSEPPSLGDSA